MKIKKCKKCNGLGKIRPLKVGKVFNTEGWVVCPKCYGKGLKGK